MRVFGLLSILGFVCVTHHHEVWHHEQSLSVVPSTISHQELSGRIVPADLQLETRNLKLSLCTYSSMVTRRTLPIRCLLAQLIEQLGMKGDRVAVELNREIVSRAQWAETNLNDGDRLEIVHFVGGGWLENYQRRHKFDRCESFVNRSSALRLTCPHSRSLNSNVYPHLLESF